MTSQPIPGALLLNAPPHGFSVFERRARIGSGLARWDFATRETLSWGIKLRSGFSLGRGEILPSEAEFTRTNVSFLSAGDAVWLRLPVGPLRLREPVRVVSVVDEAARKGFVYEARPGHQLRGEEAFIVERDDDDVVWLTVRTVSRPASGWGWARPILALGQRVVRARYFAALSGPID